jgi:hypothetical protein
MLQASSEKHFRHEKSSEICNKRDETLSIYFTVTKHDSFAQASHGTKKFEASHLPQSFFKGSL